MGTMGEDGDDEESEGKRRNEQDVRSKE